MTEFPEFQSDDEMAAWFEANNVAASNLEPTSIVIASDLFVALDFGMYTAGRTNGSSTAASGTDANSDLQPALTEG